MPPCARKPTRLAAPLSAEDCALQSMPDASPVKWHLAHTTWFFETFVLERFARDYRPFDRAFRVLFNSYYNGVGDEAPASRARPRVAARPCRGAGVSRARRSRDARDCCARRRPRARAALIELGINHEQQHQELILTDVQHLFVAQSARAGVSRARPRQRACAPRRLTWVRFDGGLAGSATTATASRSTTRCRATRCSSRRSSSRRAPVTQRRVRGVHRRRRLSAARALAVRSAGTTSCSAGWQAPLYWRARRRRWRTFTLHGCSRHRPARAGPSHQLLRGRRVRALGRARLPTEAEWESRAHAGAATSSSGDCIRRMRERRGAQLFGDVWEWTRAPTRPIPAFAPRAGAVGEYNGKFMCGQYVLRGGRCATPRSHIRVDVPQLLSAGGALAVLRAAPRARRGLTAVHASRPLTAPRRTTRSRPRRPASSARSRNPRRAAAPRIRPARTCKSSRCGCARRPRTFAATPSSVTVCVVRATSSMSMRPRAAS